MKKASELDGAIRCKNCLFSNAISSKKPAYRFKPKFTHSSSSSSRQDLGEPMDIDALSPQEVAKYKQEKLCFVCGKPGHMASAHQNGTVPDERRNGNQNQQKGARKFQQKGKGKQTEKKKFNPGQLRQHIRALIDDNFDQDSPEYEEFVKEVEEKGF
jgi:hypothetical protein